MARASAVLAEGKKGDKDFLAYDVFTHALCEAGEDDEFHFEMHNTERDAHRHTEPEERDEGQSGAAGPSVTCVSSHL